MNDFMQPSRLQLALGALGIRLIRAFVLVFGRTFRRADVPWLLGPLGPPSGPIGERPYELVARAEGLSIEEGGTAGLVPQWESLEGATFNPRATDTQVRRFYEETSAYELDVWSETRFPGRLFLWLLVSTVSRSMNQLNFPVFGLELSRGMRSDVLRLRNSDGKTVYTGWYRRSVGSGRVIYTGFYTTVQPPTHGSPCVQVTFPVRRRAAVRMPDFSPSMSSLGSE